MTIKVLVVDDQAMVRAGFPARCSADNRPSVVGHEAANGAEAVEHSPPRRPDRTSS